MLCSGLPPGSLYGPGTLPSPLQPLEKILCKRWEMDSAAAPSQEAADTGEEEELQRTSAAAYSKERHKAATEGNPSALWPCGGGEQKQQFLMPRSVAASTNYNRPEQLSRAMETPKGSSTQGYLPATAPDKPQLHMKRCPLARGPGGCQQYRKHDASHRPHSWLRLDALEKPEVLSLAWLSLHKSYKHNTQSSVAKTKPVSQPKVCRTDAVFSHSSFSWWQSSPAASESRAGLPLEYLQVLRRNTPGLRSS